MELKIDLLKTKREKSLYRIISGILFFLIASSRIIISLIGNEGIKPFDWFYFGIFTLGGVAHFIEGLGYPFESLFGKAYILINSELISLKPSVYSKEQSINWSEIKSIDYKLNKFEIKKADNTNMTINLSKLDYISINEIKKTINYIVEEKIYHSLEVQNFMDHP